MSVGIDLGALLPSQYESPGGAGVEGLLADCKAGSGPGGGYCIIWGGGPIGDCTCGTGPKGGLCVIGY